MSVSIETLLLAKQLAGSGGGGTGGTDNYADLSHKPSINNVELLGNKSAADIGVIAAPNSPSSGAFLVYNGSAWVAQTLTTWQASSY